MHSYALSVCEIAKLSYNYIEQNKSLSDAKGDYDLIFGGFMLKNKPLHKQIKIYLFEEALMRRARDDCNPAQRTHNTRKAMMHQTNDDP